MKGPQSEEEIEVSGVDNMVRSNVCKLTGSLRELRKLSVCVGMHVMPFAGHTASVTVV